MNQNSDPMLRAIRSSLVEMALRLNRVEGALGLHADGAALATFGRHADHGVEPCGCEESLALRARIAQLEDDLMRLVSPVSGPRSTGIVG